MAAIVGSQRGRVGSLLVAIGAFLLVLATVIFVTAAPAALADHNPGHDADPFPINDCGDDADAGLKIQWDIDADPPTFSVDEFEGTGLPGDMTFGDVYDGPPVNPLVYDYPDENSSGWYLDYEYEGTAYDLYAIAFKTGQGANDQYVSPVPNPGTLELPLKLSHVTFCFRDPVDTTTTTSTSTTTTTVPDTTTTTVADTTTTTVADTTTTTVADTTTTTVADTTTTTVADTTTTTVADTTTTTVADTTTTTVGGPEEPTTTTSGGGTTTTVLGPDDPELPNNGPGQLLAIFLGGLGLLFMGSGSLVIASERRLTIR
jgi:hypothetical protein